MQSKTDSFTFCFRMILMSIVCKWNPVETTAVSLRSLQTVNIFREIPQSVRRKAVELSKKFYWKKLPGGVSWFTAAEEPWHFVHLRRDYASNLNSAKARRRVIFHVSQRLKQYFTKFPGKIKVFHPRPDVQKPALSRNVDLCGAFCRILKVFFRYLWRRISY